MGIVELSKRLACSELLSSKFSAIMYRIGCDVGGTNTDAAILDTSRLNDESKGVLATFKTPTTADVTDGIKTAIQRVLDESQIDRRKVLNVAIGTTHFVNAVVENDARRLDRVAVIRLCGPYTRSVCPIRILEIAKLTGTDTTIFRLPIRPSRDCRRATLFPRRWTGSGWPRDQAS